MEVDDGATKAVKEESRGDMEKRHHSEMKQWQKQEKLLRQQRYVIQVYVYSLRHEILRVSLVERS